MSTQSHTTPTPPDDGRPSLTPALVPKAKTAPPPVSVPKAATASPPVSVPKAETVAPPIQIPRTEQFEHRAHRPVKRRNKFWAWVDRCLHWFGTRRVSSSFVTSAVLHAVVLVVLGLWVVTVDRGIGPPTLLASLGEGYSPLEPFDDSGSQTPEAGGTSGASAPLIEEHSVAIVIPIETQFATSSTPRASSTTASDQISDRDLTLDIGSGQKGPLDGRNGDMRGSLLEEEGGTPASEEAVRLGLEWLAAHQRKDGAWHFDHNQGPCGGRCTHAGTEASTTAATGMALMCFLGAGHSHKQGDYREVVQMGLDYLQSRMLVSKQGGDLQEGTMYGQALATIALCEAYAMTKDPMLEGSCHDAIRFIIWAQHGAGGWRYVPGQPGDMTVTGWQLMALKSGQMNYVPVPNETIGNASHFLDEMASDEGAAYGYQDAVRGHTTTSVGLLCRMYLGWPRTKPALQRGVAALAREGPSKNDMYFNYYATQVLHHFGGSQWHAWNNEMRDYLIETQAREGHEAGSWYFDDAHRSGERGGRLYNTCMAVMTLEVYYRYLPLYRSTAVK